MHSLNSSLSYQQIILPHQIHLGQPPGFTILYAWNCHTHHGLYLCSNYRNTLTTCTACSRSEGDAETYWGHTSFQLSTCQSHLKIHYISTRYLCTHVLIADEQFLLLIDVPIQDHAQQIEVYEVFNLDIAHGNYSAHYDIENKYLDTTLDATSAIEISEDQYQNHVNMPTENFVYWTHHFYHLPIHQHVYHALYAKDKDSIQKRCSHTNQESQAALAYQHP